MKWPYGRRNLWYILKGSHRAPDGTKELASYGALIHRSRTAIGKLVDRLIDAGLLQTRTLDHGGAVVELPQDGQAAFEDSSVLASLVREHDD